MSPDERRIAIERVDALFAPSIQIDEDQALILSVERVRLILYGALAVMAATVAAVANMARPPNPWFVGGGLLLMQASALVAWNGLWEAETLRHLRVFRKHLERQAMLNSSLGGDDPLYPHPGASKIDDARKDERGSSSRIRSRAVLSVLLAGTGFAVLLGGFLQVVEQRRSALSQSSASSTIAPAQASDAARHD